ncbi:MAG: single-stranded DNA-binding protein [Bacilli bacterium]|nr:single-stranded DNA-binding protein [Bacilli bacterium]
MINRVVIVGRITKDPVLRKTFDGTQVTSFYVAVDRPKGQDGQKTADFIPVTVWNNQAVNICKYMSKGSLVGVDGRLKQNKFTKEDGSISNIIEVVATSVSFIGSKNSKENNITTENVIESNKNEINSAKNNENGQDTSGDDSIDVDDFPF